MFWEFLSVGLGGFLGSILRFAVSKVFARVGFPLGTLLSNVLAALAIGFIIGADKTAPLAPKAKLFLTTGLMGGLSTFSTFSIETVNFFQSGKIAAGLANVGLNLGLSLVCVWVGLAVGKFLVS